MTLVICDASILILLAKIEILDVLIEVFNQIVIPPAVHNEAVIHGKKIKKLDAYYIEEKIKEKLIKVESITEIEEKERFINDFNIHDGEAEAIVLYLEKSADLLGSDDFKTIKLCKILKISYFTSLTFLYRCFVMKKLNKKTALVKIEKLHRFGWYKEELINHFQELIKGDNDD